MPHRETRPQLLSLRQLLQLHQTPLEIRTDHLLHAVDEAHRLADEVLPARHGPDHVGLIIAAREDEFGVARSLEWLHEISPRAHTLVRLAFRDGHRSGADFVVAGPVKHRTRTRRWAFERDLGVK